MDLFFLRLRRQRRLLKYAVRLYHKKGNRLSLRDKEEFATLLEKLDYAILQKDRSEAKRLATQVDRFQKAHFRKSLFDHLQEFVFAVVFAIIIAFAIRQVWFELYEVPTGSMRPTIEELDRLVVSKTTFGINPPFQNNLFLFSPDRVKRNGIIVFTVEDMNVADGDTVYFHLFPGKKRYIKRCIGKPGDTLYFYGGRVYGIDRSGNPITELSDEKCLKENKIDKIDHVPYITFDGRTIFSSPLSQGIYGEATFLHMNMPVAKLHLKQNGFIEGSFFNGKEWKKENLNALKSPHTSPQSFSDLWGIGHYAMARLLTKKEAQDLYDEIPGEGLLYLELRHTPNLTDPAPEMRRGETGRIHPTMTSFLSLIPLQQPHIDTLQKALYTSRFFVKGGHAYRYQEGDKRPQRSDYDPLFPQVPDGCYEFYYGKGYQIHYGGISTALPTDHPLYNSSSENIQKLFNLGIGFNLVYQPYTPYQPFLPQRFAYFRNGDLYVMGSLILDKEDPILKAFVKEEIDKQNASSPDHPYIAFVDSGPPLLTNGELDKDFIRTFGLHIPENGVLALGDNYAMSADSRDFGFVPTQNLRGAPSFIFWPPGKRIGLLPQPPYPWTTLPNCLIWGAVTLICVGIVIYNSKRSKKPLFKKG